MPRSQVIECVGTFWGELKSSDGEKKVADRLLSPVQPVSAVVGVVAGVSITNRRALLSVLVLLYCTVD